jgi:hypothetical protein
MSDNDLVLSSYYRSRAKFFLDNLLIPLIKQEIRNPTIDVLSDEKLRYVISSATSVLSKEKNNFQN